MNNLKQTAIHESGHLLHAILSGTRWRLATIIPDEECLGYVKMKLPKNVEDIPKNMVAGYAAESVMGLPISEGARLEYRQVQSTEGAGKASKILDEVTKKIEVHKEDLKRISDYLLSQEVLTKTSLKKLDNNLLLKLEQQATVDQITNLLTSLADS